jgi:ABC-type amino acid transport substrate-binding protein
MEDALLAYGAGRVDALAGDRDAARAKHPVTGADYRMGFLDGRIEIFRMFAGVRQILDADD